MADYGSLSLLSSRPIAMAGKAKNQRDVGSNELMVEPEYDDDEAPSQLNQCPHPQSFASSCGCRSNGLRVRAEEKKACQCEAWKKKGKKRKNGRRQKIG